MNVADTKPLEKTCSKCGVTKFQNMFIAKRNICKECRNACCRERYNDAPTCDEYIYQTCNTCLVEKQIAMFIKNRKTCKECNNKKRKDKYMNDNEHRVKIINQSTQFKQKKIKEKKEKLELELGFGNTKCKYCQLIKPNDRFRHNRLKCKDCEREEPISKIIRSVRSRILSAIRNKSKHTIEYLGCNCRNYLKWLLTNNPNYTYENYGKEWHIDHVIPVSKFNIMDENEQLIAFNWRNTMPLSCSENLKKNNKIINEQVEQHYKKLMDYHIENNLDLPQEFIDLFAKHLVDGEPLKTSLPLTYGNTCEELS